MVYITDTDLNSDEDSWSERTESSDASDISDSDNETVPRNSSLDDSDDKDFTLIEEHGKTEFEFEKSHHI